MIRLVGMPKQATDEVQARVLQEYLAELDVDVVAAHQMLERLLWDGWELPDPVEEGFGKRRLFEEFARIEDSLRQKQLKIHLYLGRTTRK